MPTNVSVVTQELRRIIQDNSDLQDVWMQGEISDISPAPNGALDFTFIDNEQKVECVIFKENAHLFADLLVGDKVLVKGRISVHRSEKSEYRFVIKNKQPFKAVPAPASVSTLIETLRRTINKHSAKVQGKIANDPTVGQTGFRQLHLKNANNAEMIVCVLPLNIATPIGHLEQKEHLLHTAREQRKEKIQQFETTFNDLKGDLLDLGSPPPPEDNTGPQKPRETKNKESKTGLKTDFQRRTNDFIIATESKRNAIVHFGDHRENQRVDR